MNAAAQQAYEAECLEIVAESFVNELEEGFVKEAGLGSFFRRGVQAARSALSTRGGKAALGLGVAGGAGAGVYTHRKRSRSRSSLPSAKKTLIGGKVGRVPSTAKGSPLYRRILGKAAQRFREIPKKTLEWLVYVAMRERNLVK